MKHWIHYNLYFKKYERKSKMPVKEWREIVHYIEAIINELLEKRLISRFFFLFEPDPHCFLALEFGEYEIIETSPEVVFKKKLEYVNEKTFNINQRIEEIKKVINEYNFSQDFSSFLDLSKVCFSTENVNDSLNGEQAVDFFMASSNYAFFKASEKYKEGYENNDEVKLLHCFFNAQGLNNRQELSFYMKCALHRGAKTIEWINNKGKKCFAQLKIKRRLLIK